MSERDEQDFVSLVHSGGGIFVAGIATAARPDVLADPREMQERVTSSTIHIWNPEISDAPLMEMLESGGCYFLNFLEAEVINYRPSFVSGNSLTLGRIHVHSPGSQAFERWYRSLSNWIRRKAPLRIDGDYLLPGAAELHARGFGLSGAAGARRPRSADL